MKPWDGKVPELKLSDSPTLSGDSSRSFSLALHIGRTFRGKWTHEARRVIDVFRIPIREKGTDERTRTADLLIASDPSGVAGGCRGLQIPHF